MSAAEVYTIEHLIAEMGFLGRAAIIRLRAAADSIEATERERVTTMLLGFGRTPEQIADFLAEGTGTRLVPPVAKRTGTIRARPEAPPDDAALLTRLLTELDVARAGTKALAGRFAGLNVDRVLTVLTNEAARGDQARVKREPNGRTWARVERL